VSPATNPKTSSATNIDSGVDGYPWSKVSEHLDEHGWALVKNLLTISSGRAPLAARVVFVGSNFICLGSNSLRDGVFGLVY